MQTVIRYLKSDEYPLAAKFLDEHWAKGHAYVLKPDLFEWTFRRADLWKHDGYSFAIALAGEEVYGILGAIPFEFNDRGKISDALWLVNWMVRADRETGAGGIRLLQFWRDKPYSHILSFGTDDTVNRLYTAMKWEVLYDIPRHFMVLPDASDRLIHLLDLTYPDWSAKRKIGLAKSFTSRVDFESETIPGETIPEDWDEHGWTPFSLNSIGCARNGSYLNWRYRDHPVFEYKFLSVRENDKIGLAVWRLETISRLNSAGQREPVDRIARLVEFMAVSERNAQVLFSSLVRKVGEENCFAIDYFGYHGMTGTWLKHLGFSELASHPDGPAIPGRFQPLDPRGGRVTSALKTTIGQLPQIPLDSSCEWYWTKSDSDQDRPN